MDRNRWMALTAASLAMLTLLSACGTSDNNTGDSSSSTTNADPQVVSAVKAARAAPKQISLPALSAPAPTGKTIDIVSCPVPECTETAKAAQRAAELLGWKAKVIDGGLTPEVYSAALDQVVADEPDGVFVQATEPISVISDQVAKLRAADIPVVSSADADPVGPSGFDANFQGPGTFRNSGKLMADYVASTISDSANIGLVSSKVFPNFVIAKNAFTKELDKVCPGCSTTDLDFSPTDIGKNLPGSVVSFLQNHPDVDTLVFTLGSATLGVPQAMEAASIPDSVKIVSRSGSPSNFQNIMAGSYEVATIGEESSETAWRATDALIRLMIGDSVDTCCANPVGEYQLLEKSNISDPTARWVTPDVEGAFKKIWGRS